MTPVISIAVAPRTSGMLDYDALPTQFLAVELVDCVVSVAVVLELHEAISIF